VLAVGGHAANSQFGPVRPTALPSGHSFASIVQEVGGDEDDDGKSFAETAGASAATDNKVATAAKTGENVMVWLFYLFVIVDHSYKG
jgi:hypothetical protein